MLTCPAKILSSIFLSEPSSASILHACADPEVGRGPDPPPPRKVTIIKCVFLQYWSESPEKSQSYMYDVGLSSAGPLWPTFSGVWILSPSSSKKLVRVGPPLAKLSGSAHVCEKQRFGENAYMSHCC